MKIKTKLILMELISLVVLALSIVWLSNNLTTDALGYRIKNTLEVAVDGYTDDVNAYKNHGIDITVFEGDTRVESSITGAVGTKASTEIIETVNKEGTYFDDNVDVNGERFYGYYRKTNTGMIFAGRDYNELHGSLTIISYVLIGVSIIFVAVWIIISYLTASKIAKPIIEVDNGIKDIANGDLTVRFNNTKADKESKDEVVNMQKSMNNMTNRLSSIVGSVIDVSNEVNKSMNDLNDMAQAISATSGDVSKAIDEVSIGAVSTAEDTEHITEMIASIGDSIENIKNNTNLL